jgi:flavin-dependent dehydrogenase
MGVIDALVAEGKAKYADSGGFVSPAGLSYIGNSVHELGESAACAIKRYHLDNAVAKKAAEAGAELMEKFEVGNDVTFDAEKGLWTVRRVAWRPGWGCARHRRWA